MITYRIDASACRAHRYRVTLTVRKPAATQRLSLPVWIPGSYLVREFARHLSDLSARQGERDVPLVQIDKATWEVRGLGDADLTLAYSVYAFDTSVRAAFLDADRGFFNGTSLCLRVEGRESEAHRIELAGLAPGWQVATALEPERVDAAGGGSYRARDYDALVDHPFELGAFWRGRFSAGGIPHEFVVAGAWPDFDGERLLADTPRICETQIGFWRAAGGDAAKPFERYVFLLNAVEDGHGGLEHRSSTALIAPRRDLPRREAPVAKAADADKGGNGNKGEKAEPGDGYVGVLGLISHEYFHSWNVKRLRPREFERYDYTRENYTELLWFFEGFTSYYDDLFLRRAGLIDPARYLKLVARTASNVAATPGRLEQSLAEASFDAWVKFYRSDENTPNATISYYAKGSLVGLALDLRLRAEGKGSLDDVLRWLWSHSRGGPIGEGDIAAALEAVGGRAYAAELAAWVHGTEDLPLPRLLEAAGVETQVAPATLAQRLGVRVAESALTGIKVTHVLRGGVAEGAGVAPGDEIIGVEGWRLRRLDDAIRLIGPGRPAQLLVSRDQRLLTLPIALPEGAGGAGAITLRPAATPTPAALALYKAWLDG